jgi:raffinose/stachyose/melibiose transport system substrate-binding protein
VPSFIYFTPKGTRRKNTMKGSKFVSLLMLLVIVAISVAACGTPAPTAAPEQPAAPANTEAPAAPANTEAPAAEAVTLTLGSWRVDDTEAWGKILDAFHAKYPNITVKFDPTNPPDYNATLRT